MNILDLSNYTPLRFGFTEQPETYDYEKLERQMMRLKLAEIHATCKKIRYLVTPARVKLTINPDFLKGGRYEKMR